MATLDSVLFFVSVGVGFLIGHTGCRGALATYRDWKEHRMPRMHDSWVREQRRMALKDDWRQR